MSDRQPSVLSTPDQVRAAVALTASEPQVPKMVDGGPTGTPGEQYRKVAGTASAFYNIPHSLGVVPAYARLYVCQVENQPNCNLHASSSDYHKWTSTEVRVRVDALSGGTNGTTMWFIIGGMQ